MSTFSKSEFGRLEFRRAAQVVCAGQYLGSFVEYPNQDGSSHVHYTVNKPRLTTAEQEHFLKGEMYDGFTVITTSKALRRDYCHEMANYPLRAFSGNFASLNFFTLSFGECVGTGRIPRLGRPNPENPKQQIPGDLIAGVVDHDTQTFTKWTYVSEQFLHYWTIMMWGESDDSFTKVKGGVYKHLMSGNRLAGNSFKKWFDGEVANGKQPSMEEIRQHFYTNPYEVEANFIDFYPFMVQKIVYKKIAEPVSYCGKPRLSFHLPVSCY
jgi:hypothetical protein